MNGSKNFPERIIKSNTESGVGYSDILIETPEGVGVNIEEAISGIIEQSEAAAKYDLEYEIKKVVADPTKPCII